MVTSEFYLENSYFQNSALFWSKYRTFIYSDSRLITNISLIPTDINVTIVIDEPAAEVTEIM